MQKGTGTNQRACVQKPAHNGGREIKITQQNPGANRTSILVRLSFVALRFSRSSFAQ